MDEEIKDEIIENTEGKENPEGANAAEELDAAKEQDAAEDMDSQDEGVSHSDYHPTNRFDASAVHHLSGMYQNWFLD